MAQQAFVKMCLLIVAVCFQLVFVCFPIIQFQLECSFQGICLKSIHPPGTKANFINCYFYIPSPPVGQQISHLRKIPRNLRIFSHRGYVVEVFFFCRFSDVLTKLVAARGFPLHLPSRDRTRWTDHVSLQLIFLPSGVVFEFIAIFTLEFFYRFSTPNIHFVARVREICINGENYEIQDGHRVVSLKTGGVCSIDFSNNFVGLSRIWRWDCSRDSPHYFYCR